MGIINKRRRIIAIGRSVAGQPFQVITPNSVAHTPKRVPGADYTAEGAALSKVEMMAEGRKAYFDRRGPGYHKMRALGWIEAYQEEKEELEARREERLGNF